MGLFKVMFIFPMENPPEMGNRLSEYVLFFGNPESANPSLRLVVGFKHCFYVPSYNGIIFFPLTFIF